MKAAMYAIIETGGKQYKVAQGDTFLAERLLPKKGKTLQLDKVLLAHDGKKTKIGTPYLSGAKVVCELLGEEKAKKVIHYRFKRRQNYHRTIGHRQKLVRLKVQELTF